MFEGLGMVGREWKVGKGYGVRGFESGEGVRVEYVNEFVMEDRKGVRDLKYKWDLRVGEGKKK